MSYQDAYLRMLNKYFGFEGRATLGEFWKPFAINFVVGVVLAILELPIHALVFLAYLFYLVILFPGLALLFRRLHDTGLSGWWWLVGLIPLVGWLVILYLAARPGNPDSNSYGPPSDVSQIA